MPCAVICFTRVPRPEQTKTRLLPILSAQQCAALQTAFLQDLAHVYQALSSDLLIAYAPDPDPAALHHIFPTAKALFVQKGNDLGARMLHAIQTVLDMGYSRCVLTGSDLPFLSTEHLHSGFTALEQADLALGPTTDGGYYLIGMKRLCPEVFAHQPYGSSTVWQNTLAAAKAAGYTVAAALPCDDVDTPEDLLRLAIQGARIGSHTADFLSAIQKEGVLDDGYPGITGISAK